MLIPHLHFKGECYQAMEAYERAFGATIQAIIFVDKEKPEKGVRHAEMLIQGQTVMLNDNRSEDCSVEYPFIQLVMTFHNELELKNAYELLKDEQRVVSPMKAAEFTACTVGFWDKFGIRWGFMVQ